LFFLFVIYVVSCCISICFIDKKAYQSEFTIEEGIVMSAYTRRIACARNNFLAEVRNDAEMETKIVPDSGIFGRIL
jgi:hypothetical protein